VLVVDLTVAADPTVRPFLDVGSERLEEVLGRVRDVTHGCLERRGVPGGRRAIAADLADELERGGLDLPGGGRLVRTAELLDASAHDARVADRLARDRQCGCYG
jgi:hypothetical protein